MALSSKTGNAGGGTSEKCLWLTINLLAAATLAITTAAFVWRLAVPDVPVPFRSASAVYLILLLSLIPLVSIIGWFGAKLTFPMEKE